MIVLDANILIRAVLGSRVLFLLRKYAGRVEFVAPDTAFQEAPEPGISCSHPLYNDSEEMVMSAEYVERRNGGYYVKGTRVSLDSIVCSFQDGESPETIRQNFPSLTLEQVYGAITFYLAHQADVDANIREGEKELERSVRR
jgi:uncharacterized protein (DUF433 family)